MKMIRLLFFTLTASLLTGCIFLPEDVTPAVSTSDLAPLKISAVPCESYVVDPFINRTRSEFKMTSVVGGRSVRDEYSQWVQTPQNMLTREYSRLFSGKKGSPARYLSGIILGFHKTVGKDGKAEAVLHVRYQVSDPSGKVLWSKDLTDTAPVRGNTGNDFADAMSENLRKQAETLVESLNGGMK